MNVGKDESDFMSSINQKTVKVAEIIEKICFITGKNINGLSKYVLKLMELV